MTKPIHRYLGFVACGVIGIAIGGIAAYSFMMFVFSGFAALHYESDIQNVALHQRIYEEIADGEIELASTLLEGLINGEIYYVDGLLTSEADGLNQGHRNSIHAVLERISNYRSRPEFRERVHYVGNDEPGDAEVWTILERYQTDTP